MKILVNALSVTNQSGRHLLTGHLSRIARWTAGRNSFVILFHPGNRDLVEDWGPNVEWRECPPRTSHWAFRAIWERLNLPCLIRETGAEGYFTPSGAAVFVGIPQMVLCPNPWCLVPEVGWRGLDRIKAALQRMAYRRAVRVASVMVYTSGFMQRAYEANAGQTARQSFVVPLGLGERFLNRHDPVPDLAGRFQLGILSVSVMAPHKRVEILVEAVSILHRDFGIVARLELVGPWPDEGYRLGVEKLISTLGLSEAVMIRGAVSEADLSGYYSRARVFSLMSCCESFGFPALEAQSCGTPVVCANNTSMPEISGAGGLYPPVNDARQAAEALRRLLTDDLLWQDLATKALANARRYDWDHCARELLKAFDQLEVSMKGRHTPTS